MRNRTDDDRLLIGFLLGELPEEEQLQIEQRFFTDDDFHQQLMAMEDELRYDYAQGGLTPGQRQHFEERFLTTADDRERVATAKAVLNKAFSVAQASTAAAVSRQPWWKRLADRIALPGGGMQLALAMSTVITVIGAAWMLVEMSRQRSEAERQIAAQRNQLNQLNHDLADERARRAQLEKDRTASPSFLAFLLPPGLTRDAQETKRLLIPPEIQEVHLQLDVSKKGGFQAYRASLQTLDGNELWSERLPASPSVTLSLPARILAPGDYLVNLKGVLPSGETAEAGDFAFTVVSR